MANHQGRSGQPAWIEVDCPEEILLGLHLDAEQFGELVELGAAIVLFREKMTSGVAARWRNIARVHFLLKVMRESLATLLEDNEDNFTGETPLL